MDSPNEQTVQRSGFLFSLFTIAGFFLFLAIVAYVWFDSRPSTVAHGGPTPEERAETLREFRARDQELLHKYGWIDQDAGIVRLPVERGMELFLDELNQAESQESQN